MPVDDSPRDPGASDPTGPPAEPAHGPSADPPLARPLHLPLEPHQGSPWAQPISGIAAPPQRFRRDAMLLPDKPRTDCLLDVLIALGLVVMVEFGWAIGLPALVPPPPGVVAAGQREKDDVEAPATGLKSATDPANKASGLDEDEPWQDEYEEWQRTLLIPGLVLRAIGVLAVVALMLRLRNEPLVSVGLTARRLIGDGACGLLTLVVASILLVALTLLLALLSPTVREQMEENTELLLRLLPRLRVWWVVLMMACVALWEEVLFRGFLLTRVRRLVGNWTVAVVLVTAVFTLPHLAHQTPSAMIPVAVLGLLLSGVTILRRSLVPALIAHWLFNVSQVLWMYYMTRGPGP